MLSKKKRNALTRASGCTLATALICVTAATGAWAHKSRHQSYSPDDDPTIPSYYPTPTRHYLKSSVNICDQGSFFVGGMLKKTYYERSSTRSATPQVVMIGQMYVEFQFPMKYNDWPVIFVSGGAHTGASLESTPDGREGWAPYALRHNIPTFVVDQSGRGRSGFDASVIHEGVALLTDGDPSNDDEGKALIPNFLVLGTADWWNGTFGHLVNPATGQPTGPGPANVLVDQLVPHGWSSLDPDTNHGPGVMPQFPIHATSPEIIPDNLVPKGEQVPGTLAGPQEYYLLNYWRELVPNSEQTLPYGLCPTCDPQEIAGGGFFASGHTWTSRNVAELVEQLGKIYGGAIVATHSQSGPIGHHAVRILKQRGTLKYLKGLITVEGTSVTLAGAGLTAADFDDVPYLVVKGDYSGTSSASQGIVDAIIARRRQDHKGHAAVEYIKLDEAPSTANAWPYPLNRPVMQGITHMMMDGSDEGYGYDSSDVFDVILKWSNAHISKMKKRIMCTRALNKHDRQ